MYKNHVSRSSDIREAMMTMPATGSAGSTTKSGLVLRLTVVWGTLGAYAALWTWFFLTIWRHDDHPVELSPKGVFATAAIGSILSSYFAVAVGVQRQNGQVDVRRADVGHTVIGRNGWLAIVTNVGAYLYVLIGVAAFVTVIFRSAQSPESVEALATTFFAVVVAVVGSVFAPGQKLEEEVAAEDDK